MHTCTLYITFFAPSDLCNIISYCCRAAWLESKRPKCPLNVILSSLVVINDVASLGWCEIHLDLPIWVQKNLMPCTLLLTCFIPANLCIIISYYFRAAGFDSKMPKCPIDGTLSSLVGNNDVPSLGRCEIYLNLPIWVQKTSYLYIFHNFFVLENLCKIISYYLIVNDLTLKYPIDC